MIERLRNWLNTTPGRVVTLVGLLILGGIAVSSVYSSLRGPESIRAMSEQVYVCSETKKSFTKSLSIGDTSPVESPYSDKKTGYPAELCFWTKDGKFKADPTYVLLESYTGKNVPTFCPDCDRLVQPRNPPAGEDFPPPPTRAQFGGR